ncbi:hypothetical protein [Peredibacter starrii]|uniref:Uncharacterized protein n=1 Tax=Peredibacter starrii TaxID=28202 RepID=A0AAX4HKX4_9BACT|nr:hypothetical protein [Peredibacter starrii]WPU63937.1 hypothetical protein SOO65_14675 [Peredibacter starrii]
MRLFIGLWLISMPLFAAQTVNLRNDREGKSYYATSSYIKSMNKALGQVSAAEIEDALEDTLKDTTPQKLCSFDLNASLENKLKARNPRFNQLVGAIYYLRSENHIDDTVMKLLLKANDTTSSYVRYNGREQKDTYLPDSKTTNEALELIGSFEKRFLKNGCFDEGYRALYGEMLKVNKQLKDHQIESLYITAFDNRLISQDLYKKLEQARANDLQNSTLTLKSYHQKIGGLRLQYPLRDPNEKSNYITQKVDKEKVSHRTRLLENYTDLQIMLMGNVIKKLRERLESPKIEILVYNKETLAETITLEPMERFRFAIRILRKEMTQLSLNTYFEGRQPGYLDLMAAAYEIGIVTASEIEELASLQDIWNPKKTWWEKARVWVNIASSVATVVIPPPYGFIPALAIVVIEATTEKSKNGNELDPTSLF